MNFSHGQTKDGIEEGLTHRGHQPPSQQNRKLIVIIIYDAMWECFYFILKAFFFLCVFFSYRQTPSVFHLFNSMIRPLLWVNDESMIPNSKRQVVKYRIGQWLRVYFPLRKVIKANDHCLFYHLAFRWEMRAPIQTDYNQANHSFLDVPLWNGKNAISWTIPLNKTLNVFIYFLFF